MKHLTRLSVFATLTVAAGAHYTYPALIVNGVATDDWQYVRKTANINAAEYGPVMNISDPALRCYDFDDTIAAKTSIATISAGASVGFTVSGSGGLAHSGYLSIYMAPAIPSANATDAGSGATWFKIWDWGPTLTTSGYSGSALLWPSQGSPNVTFPLSRSLPDGQYLLRIEHAAVHTPNSPQFYIACAQVKIVDGGNGRPSGMVSIPGVYMGNEPGLFFDQYNLPQVYVYPTPGPAVWRG